MLTLRFRLWRRRPRVLSTLRVESYRQERDRRTFLKHAGVNLATGIADRDLNVMIHFSRSEQDERVSPHCYWSKNSDSISQV